MRVERSLFVLTGAPGSGKTAILRELVRLGFFGVSEPARDLLAEQRAMRGNEERDMDPQLFCHLMLERAIADYQRLEGAGEPTFFDRGIPDMVGYAEIFGLDISEASAASWRYRYNEPVFVLPAWPEIYVTDGDRQITFESARAFGERVRKVYLDLGPRNHIRSLLTEPQGSAWSVGPWPLAASAAIQWPSPVFPSSGRA